jgi:GNAT superfamily N-acetyltransferase
MSLKVRKGTLDDVKSFVALGKIMHEESAFAGVEWNQEKVMTFGRVAVTHKDFCTWGADDNGVPVAMVIAQVVPYYFSDELRLCDHLWYIDKNYRGGDLAKQLIDKLITFAKERGVKEIYSGVSTGIDVHRPHAILENKGFEHLGGLYKYKVQG